MRFVELKAKREAEQGCHKRVLAMLRGTPSTC